MKDRKERLSLHDHALKGVEAHLQKLGFVTCRTGQESWLSSKLHDCIKDIRDDKTVDLLRFFPDLAVFHGDWGTFLIQVKATSKKHRDGPNFSIETASLNNDKLLAKASVRVLIIWENKPGEFYAERAENVSGKELTFEETKSFDGSGTPTTLVKKKSIDKLDKFLTYSQERMQF